MSHLQSNNEDGAEKHLEYLLDECPFEEFVILGDLNHNNADGIVGVKKNNDTKFLFKYGWHINENILYKGSKR